MHFLVRTLQSETSDTDLRLVVEFERSRYMVNCGEGSTRTSGQRREKTKNMRAIFLTRVDSDTSAGLPGWIMTQADGAATHPSNPPYVIDLVAPPPILPFLATARRYTNRPNVDLRLRALPHPPPAAAAAAPGQAAPSPAQGAREQGPNPPASAQHPPEPVYQDEYLTAYAACVLPSSFSFSVPVPASSGPGRASTGTGTGTGSKRLHQEMAMASDLEAARRELGRLGKELDEPDEPDALDELPEAGEVAGVAEVAQVADDEMDAGVPAGTAAGATAGEVDGAVGDGVGDGAEGERRVKRRVGEAADADADADAGRVAEFLPLPSAGLADGEPAPAVATTADAVDPPAAAAGPAVDEDTRTPEEIIRSWSYAGFTPTSLTGRAAQLWRKLLLASMFPLSESFQALSTPSDPPLPALANKRQVLQHLARNPYDLPPASPPRAPYATSYVLRGPQFRGKFVPARADALGVPNGRVRGMLATGQTVTLPNGTVVTPDMCMDPPAPPSAIIVVDCPSVEYVENLLAEPAMHPGALGEDVRMQIIVHRVGKDVLADARYVEWMNLWGPACHHLIANKELCPNDISMVSCAYFQLRMSALSADAFRVPQYTLVPAVPLSSFPGLPSNTQPLLAGHEMALHPLGPLAVVNTHKDLFHKALEGEETVAPPRIAGTVAARIANDWHGTHARPRPGDDVRIVALGTASAAPSKYRNTSSMLVQYPDGRGIMLDVGEGTWGQMTRHFGVLPGRPNAYTALRHMRLLFLSHIHGDHHIGTARLLVQRRKLSPAPEPLYVLANWVIACYLREYSTSIEDLGWDDPAYIRLIDTDCIVDPEIDGPAKSPKSPEAMATARTHLGEVEHILDMKSILPTEVIHRARCHALVCRRNDGFSFAYSADTMPCETLVKAAQGVRVLIHEATFADDEQVNAVRKTHSTAGQAITMGRKIGAEHTLLTHFSQRYPKMPALNQDDGAPAYSRSPSPFSSPVPEHRAQTADLERRTQTAAADALPKTYVSCAFDHLDIEVGQLWKVRHYMRGVLQILLHMDKAGDGEIHPDVASGGGKDTVLSQAQAERVVNQTRKSGKGNHPPGTFVA